MFIGKLSSSSKLEANEVVKGVVSNFTAVSMEMIDVISRTEECSGING